MQMSSVSRPVMSTVAEINSEPARKRTLSIRAVAIPGALLQVALSSLSRCRYGRFAGRWTGRLPAG